MTFTGNLNLQKPLSDSRQVVISVEPILRGEAGHDWIYQLTIQSAARVRGLTCTVAVAWDLEKTADGWQKSLPSHAKEPRGVVENYLYLIKLVGAIASTVRRNQAHAERVFLVIQSFSGTQLFAFSIACALLNRPLRKITPLVVWRHPVPADLSGKVGISNWLLQRLTHNAAYFSDTEPLKQTNASRLSYPVRLLPITHGDAQFRLSQPERKSNVLRCWWPGPPRKAKGLDLVRALIRELPSSAAIQIKAAASSNLSSLNANFQSIDDQLTRAQYVRHMLESDVVLTPYSAEAYKLNSSGIFVEAICAGKVVLSLQGTWMAHELKLHGLEAFVLESDVQQWVSVLTALSLGNMNTEGFSAMRQHYLDFHTEKTFADVFFAADI